MSYAVAATSVLAASAFLIRQWYNSKMVSTNHVGHVFQKPSRRLPVEVIERVADSLFATRGPSASRDGTTPIYCAKPQWTDVAGFMEASLELHKIGYIRWILVFTIRHHQDWQILAPVRHLVRELHCADGVFSSVLHQTELAKFTHLYTLSIDAHGDVQHDDRGRFAYRDLFSSLPGSLRRLEITRAHGPDMKTIAAVKEYCPSLEELRLGRCTVFNSPTICRFWQTFPLDHDSYMSIEDTDSYAHSPAQELVRLQSLRSLLGLYLVPSTTILAHKLFHRRNVVAPELIEWQHAITSAALLDGEILGHDAALLNPPPATTDQLSSILYEADPFEEFESEHMCELCVESVSQIGHDAETRANTILKELLPNLANVEWMAWLSPGHIGVNAYEL